MAGEQNFSFAVDAGRMGQKNTFAGIIARPSGHAVLCLPQAVVLDLRKRDGMRLDFVKGSYPFE